MTDKVVELEASDLFAMGVNFHENGSSSPATRDPAMVIGATGDVQCEKMINARTDYTNSFGYCNDTPDIKADLSTHLTEFGNVVDGKMVSQMVITFAAGIQATVDMTGHNHDDNPHAAGLPIGHADVSAAVPASAGEGVPDFGLTLGTDATPNSATLTFSSNHIDREDTDGAHWAGKSITFRAELVFGILGIPTSVTVAAIETDLTGWIVDTHGPDDSNSDFDGFNITAHRHFDLTTV